MKIYFKILYFIRVTAHRSKYGFFKLLVSDFPTYIQTIISFNKHLPFKRVNSGKRNKKHITNDTESFKKNASKKSGIGEIRKKNQKKSKHSKQTHIINVKHIQSSVFRSLIHFAECLVDKWI